MSTRPTGLSALRRTVATRRAARRNRLRVERELAEYSSPSERRELDAILSRHTAEETRAVEVILHGQAQRRAARAPFPARNAD